MSEHEIKDKALREIERLRAETSDKVRDINAEVYQSCVETATHMREAKIHGQAALTNLKQESSFQRLNAEKEQLQQLSEIKAQKNRFLEKHERECREAESKLSASQAALELETEIANEREEERAREFGITSKELLEQKEAYLKIQTQKTLEEIDREYAQNVQEIGDKSRTIEGKADDETKSARRQLEEFKLLELAKQEEIRAKAAEERKKSKFQFQSLLPSWSLKSQEKQKPREKVDSVDELD